MAPAALGMAILLAPAESAVAVPGPDVAAEGPSEYRIGAADVLQVVVWKEPDLTREVTVRFDGMVTLPLIGDVAAAGQTPALLAEDITAKLSRFIELPRVTVGVSQANSARFYIVGQTARSGEFPLSRRMTVLQCLALAGGFKEFAKTESIVIVRSDGSVLAVNYKRIADGKDLTQNVTLRAGDTIVVP
jgi:polysaccharide export outer membrane protein